MVERAATFAVVAIALGVCASAPDSNLGRRPSAAEVAAADLTIFADGRGLPRGRGSVADGAVVYREQCAGCHGARGEGAGTFPAVAGAVGSLRSPKPLLTVGSYWPTATSLFEYTRRAMPYATPGSLKVDQVYAVSAYVLFLNGVVGADAVLDQRSLAAVAMPNAKGFDVGSPPP
jgi:S-disulfanyl-L-cysteine oxidoreductase SoxD